MEVMMGNSLDYIVNKTDRTSLQISASIIETLALWMPRSSIRGLVNDVNSKFKEDNIPLKITFSHESKKIRVKEIKN